MAVHLEFEWNIFWFGFCLLALLGFLSVFIHGVFKIVKERSELQEENHQLLLENSRLAQQLEQNGKSKGNNHQ